MSLDPTVSRKDVQTATVGVGSNVGDRETIIREAIRWLRNASTNRLVASSSLYETEPYGRKDQRWFLNCVIQMETSLDMKAFFHLLQECEARFGRRRREPWGPRTLDLDLLFFGQAVYSDAELTVPHPGAAHRRFVLEPLCEIAPDLVHPSLGEKAAVLLARLVEPSRVLRLGRNPVGRPL